MSLSTQIKSVESLTASRQTSVGKLLLNAWSAEFALRIKPIIYDRDYLNDSLNWAFPQAYFATLFSARAVLAVDGIRVANPDKIEKLLNQWAQGGLYGHRYTQSKNLFSDLMTFSRRGQYKPVPTTGPEAAALQIKLTEKIHALSIVHETYILDRLGADSYRLLIERLPAHFDFARLRATFLLNNE